MSQVFDINSFLASLQGNANYLQNKITSLNSEISNLSTQPATQLVAYHYDSDTGQPIYDTVPSTAANTISADQAQLPSLQQQLDQIKTQITATQAQISLQNVPRTTPSASSPGLSSLKLPNLSNISPIFLIGGAALLFLILK